METKKNSEYVTSIPVSTLAIGQYVLIRDPPIPIIITNFTRSKPGKVGLPKLFLSGNGIFDGKKYEEILRLPLDLPSPIVHTLECEVLDLKKSGACILLDLVSNEMKEDFEIEGEVLDQVFNMKTEKDKQVLVSVVSAMGTFKVLNPRFA